MDMKILIINGSPRGKSSNSTLLMEYFNAGFLANPENDSETIYLKDQKKLGENVQKFLDHETIVFIFPLYCDAMPGIVMRFIEELGAKREQIPGKTLGFIIQSGFPEGIHCAALADYLEKLTSRLQCNYLGTVIKGGVEGIKNRPKRMIRGVLNDFYDLGLFFGKFYYFDKKLKKKLLKPYKLSKFAVVILKKLLKTGLFGGYWNKQLKKNGVFERRFEKPY
jgi:NAD(P)H-dependent FMN reductase